MQQERVPVGAPVQDLDLSGIDLLPGHGCEEPRGLFGFEALEQELLDVGQTRQSGHCRSERVPVIENRRSIACEEQDAGFADPCRDDLDELEGSGRAVLQVVDDEDERLAPGGAAQRSRHGVEGLETRSGLIAFPDRRVRGEKPRDRRNPELFAPLGAEFLADRREHLRRTVVGRRRTGRPAPPGVHRGPESPCVLRDLGRRSRLADPGFPAEQDGAPGAADGRGRAHPQSREQLRTPHVRVARDARAGADDLHGGKEPEAAPARGRNQARLTRLVLQRTPEVAHDRVHRGLAHPDVRPHGGQDVLA